MQLYEVHGRPRPKERPRGMIKSVKGKPRLIMYTPKNTVDAQKHIAHEVLFQLDAKYKLVATECVLFSMFYMPDKRVADTNNIERLLEDALTGVIYEDDKYVKRIFTGMAQSPVTRTIFALVSLKEFAKDPVAHYEQWLQLVAENEAKHD